MAKTSTRKSNDSLTNQVIKPLAPPVLSSTSKPKTAADFLSDIPPLNDEERKHWADVMETIREMKEHDRQWGIREFEAWKASNRGKH